MLTLCSFASSSRRMLPTEMLAASTCETMFCILYNDNTYTHLPVLAADVLWHQCCHPQEGVALFSMHCAGLKLPGFMLEVSTTIVLHAGLGRQGLPFSGCQPPCSSPAPGQPRLLRALRLRCSPAAAAPAQVCYPLRPAWQLSSMQLPLASIWLCRAGRRHLRSHMADSIQSLTAHGHPCESLMR